MALSIPRSTTFVKTREAIKWHCYPRRGRLIALKLIFAALNRSCHSFRFRAVTKVQLVVLNIRHAEKINYRWKETIRRVVKHVFNCAKPSRTIASWRYFHPLKAFNSKWNFAVKHARVALRTAISNLLHLRSIVTARTKTFSGCCWCREFFLHLKHHSGLKNCFLSAFFFTISFQHFLIQGLLYLSQAQLFC